MASDNLYLGNGAISSSTVDKLKITLKDGSVTEGKIAAKAVTTNKIADNAVTPDKLSSEAYSYLGNKITVNVEGYSSLTISFDEATGMLYFEAE